MEYELQWFAKDGDGGEKTEPATSKKLQDARNEGQVAKSQELNYAISLIALFIILKIFISYIGENLFYNFAANYKKIPDFIDESIGGMSVRLATLVINNTILTILKILAPVLVIGFLVALLSNILQVGWKVTTKPMKPKFSKLNPLNGFKRIFSKDSMFELVKSIAKIGLILYVAYSAISDHQDELFLLYDIPLLQVILLVGDIVISAGLNISLVYMLVGIADWCYQKHKFKEDMKMTKQEVKDEYKNTEGNPEIKGRQRSKMREASQRRMMQELPNADVVIPMAIPPTRLIRVTTIPTVASPFTYLVAPSIAPKKLDSCCILSRRSLACFSLIVPVFRSASIAICFPGIASRVNLAVTSDTRSEPLLITIN